MNVDRVTGEIPLRYQDQQGAQEKADAPKAVEGQIVQRPDSVDLAGSAQRFQAILESGLLEGSVKEEGSAEYRETGALRQHPEQEAQARPSVIILPQAPADTGQGGKGNDLLSQLMGMKPTGDLQEDVEQYAETYARYWRAAEREPGNASLTGKEPQIQEGMHQYARNASSRLNMFLASYASPETASRADASIREAIQERAVQYTAFSRIRGNGSRRLESGFVSRPEAGRWIEQPGILRQAAAESRVPFPEVKPPFYPFRDLRLADRLAGELMQLEQAPIPPHGKNEELLGLELGFVRLKTLVACGLLGEAQPITQALRDAVEAYDAAYLQRIEDTLAAQQRLTPAGSRGYAPLDRDAIREVVRRILQEYARTADAEKALREGIFFAKRVFGQKKRSDVFLELYRYKWARDIWDGCYLLAKSMGYSRHRPEEAFKNSWNRAMGRMGADPQEHHRMTRALYDSGVLESLLPHIPMPAVGSTLWGAGAFLFLFLVFITAASKSGGSHSAAPVLWAVPTAGLAGACCWLWKKGKKKRLRLVLAAASAVCGICMGAAFI